MPAATTPPPTSPRPTRDLVRDRGCSANGTLASAGSSRGLAGRGFATSSGGALRGCCSSRLRATAVDARGAAIFATVPAAASMTTRCELPSGRVNTSSSWRASTRTSRATSTSAPSRVTMKRSPAGIWMLTRATFGRRASIAAAASSLCFCARAITARAARRLDTLASRTASLPASSSLSRNTITRFHVSSARAYRPARSRALA